MCWAFALRTRHVAVNFLPASFFLPQPSSTFPATLAPPPRRKCAKMATNASKHRLHSEEDEDHDFVDSVSTRKMMDSFRTSAPMYVLSRCVSLHPAQHSVEVLTPKGVSGFEIRIWGR